MKIAILGSWHAEEKDLPFRRSFEEFKNACTSIGEVFAAESYSIVLCSEAQNTADRHVFDSYLKYSQASRVKKPSIKIIYPKNGQWRPFEKAATFSWISYAVPRYSDWLNTHLDLLREVDVVVVIGGRWNTYHSSLAAVLADKVVVPVGAFGGAGEKLLGDIQPIMSAELQQAFQELNNWNDGKENSLVSTLAKAISDKNTDKTRLCIAWDVTKIGDLVKSLTVPQACGALFAVSAVLGGFVQLGYWLGQLTCK